VGLYYELRRTSGNGSYTTSSSGHAVPTFVKAGETNDVVVGGNGRTITGRIQVTGADPSDVDWKREFHSISLRVPGNPELEPVTMTGVQTDEERQKFWQDRNEWMKAFWRTEKGRELEMKQRSYVPQFETNGIFIAYNIPSGTYDMYVHVTDPNDETTAIGRSVIYRSRSWCPTLRLTSRSIQGRMKCKSSGHCASGRRRRSSKAKRSMENGQSDEYLGKYVLVICVSLVCAVQVLAVKFTNTYLPRYSSD